VGRTEPASAHGSGGRTDGIGSGSDHCAEGTEAGRPDDEGVDHHRDHDAFGDVDRDVDCD